MSWTNNCHTLYRTDWRGISRLTRSTYRPACASEVLQYAWLSHRKALYTDDSEPSGAYPLSDQNSRFSIPMSDLTSNLYIIPYNILNQRLCSGGCFLLIRSAFLHLLCNVCSDTLLLNIRNIPFSLKGDQLHISFCGLTRNITSHITQNLLR